MFAKQILAALCLCVALAGIGVAAPLKVEKRVIKEERPTYTVDIVYPRTGRAVIDAPLETWAKEVEREFRAANAGDGWAEDDAARRTIQQGQREWLQRRDGVCLRAGQPLVACLTDSYQRGLQALDEPPA